MTKNPSPSDKPIDEALDIDALADEAELAGRFDEGFNAGWNKAISQRVTARILKTIDEDKHPVGSFTVTVLGYLTMIGFLYAFVYVVSTAWHEGEG